jgi:hypothetical protein
MGIVHCTSMVSNTIATMNKTVKLGITLPNSIIQKIDKNRADIPRAAFYKNGLMVPQTEESG